MFSKYAARATKSAEQCSLRGVVGHLCSPLCQWARCLRGLLTIEYTNDPHVSAMLQPTLFHALVLNLQSENEWKCLEAIELVLLAAQLDPVQTWKTVLRTDCAVQNYLPSLMMPAETAPRLCLLPYRTKALTKCLRCLRKPWLRSPRFWLTRNWLLNSHCGAWYDSEQRMQKIPVMLQWKSWSRLNARTTRQLCTLAARSQAKQARFQLVEISTNDQNFSLHRLKEQKQQEQQSYQITDVFNAVFTQADLLRLHDAGIHIQFSSNDGWSSGGYPTRTFVRGDLTNVVEVFKFWGDISSIPDEWWFLLREAGDVKEVYLKLSGPLQSMRHQHRATTAALLDPRSPTSVKHVYLRGSIGNEALSDMLQVLRSDDPFEQLGWGQLTTSRYRPTARSHLRSLSLELQVSIVQDDTLVFELLRMVGFGLETLVIESSNGWLRLDENDFAMLFSACPKLQCLSLFQFSLASLDPFVNVYNNTGLCPLLTSFIHVGRVVDVESVASLFEACNDPHQRVHRTLRDIEFKDQQEYPQSVLHRIFDALRCNRTLRHIALDLAKHQYTTERSDELLHISQTPVLVHSDTMPLTHKLALLSALQSRLDQDACRRVLEFTSVMEPRRILCEVGQRKPGW